MLLLNPATSYKSPAHSSTGTRSDNPPTACQLTVSCSFSLPYRGFYFTFPSLYFFTIGHSGVFSLTRWSSLIHTGFHVPHATRDFPSFKSFWLLDFHHLWCRIQLLRLFFVFIVFGFPQPHLLKVKWFRLFPFRSPLLRESLLLSFPPATEMFQFTGLPLPFLWIQKGVLLCRGCPIRESSDLCLLPAPRSVSPVSAPFIVSECLGLHRKPSFLWPKKMQFKSIQHKKKPV